MEPYNLINAQFINLSNQVFPITSLTIVDGKIDAINAINHKLGNYEKTISLSKPSYLKQGNDKDVQSLISDMNAGDIDALIIYNVNPSYTLPNADEFNNGLSKVMLKVAVSMYMDETTEKMNYVCADNHNLESWGDANPSHGVYTLMQPTIRPLFNSRQFQDCLLIWYNSSDKYYDRLKTRYSTEWNKRLHDGYFQQSEKEITRVFDKEVEIQLFPLVSSQELEKKIYEFEVAEKISMGDGRQSNNPWLQELPDPLSRACWDNYLTISASTARELNLKNWNVSNGALNGDIVNITLGNKMLKNVPVMIQPGQAKRTVSLAVGYGRNKAGNCGNGVGVNAYPLSKGGQVKIKKVSGVHEFAATQLHHTMMGRDLVKETTLEEYIKNPRSGNNEQTYATHEGPKKASEVTLWDEFDHESGHFWNMSIDLTSCIG